MAMLYPLASNLISRPKETELKVSPSTGKAIKNFSPACSGRTGDQVDLADLTLQAPV